MDNNACLLLAFPSSFLKFCLLFWSHSLIHLSHKDLLLFNCHFFILISNICLLLLWSHTIIHILFVLKLLFIAHCFIFFLSNLSILTMKELYSCTSKGSTKHTSQRSSYHSPNCSKGNHNSNIQEPSSSSI